jgi:NADH:ubiquinone oxidoreductase subunit 2 (subunit N)
MYVEEPEIETPVVVPTPLFLAILICVIGTVVMGLYPEPWVRNVMDAARGLF